MERTPMSLVEAYDPSSYEPKGYVIKLPEASDNRNRSYKTKPIPLWLLIDQTVAVVWDLYSPHSRGDSLGIAQLKWVHGFLKGIKDERGVQKPDIRYCVRDIEKKLADDYARLAEGMDKPEKIVEYVVPPRTIEKPKKQQEQQEKETDFVSRADDREVEETTFCCGKRKRKVHKATSKSSVKSTTASEVSEGDVIYEENLTEQESGTSTTKPNLKKPDEYSYNESIDSGKSEYSDRHKIVSFTSAILKEGTRTPSSVTYEDIMSRTKLCETKHPIPRQKQSYFAPSPYELEGDTSDVDDFEQTIDSILRSDCRKFRSDVSKHEILNFLVNWRNEQKEKVKDEIKRYSNIENMIKTLKKDMK